MTRILLTSSTPVGGPTINFVITYYVVDSDALADAQMRARFRAL
jgi:hypothetical protein